MVNTLLAKVNRMANVMVAEAAPAKTVDAPAIAGADGLAQAQKFFEQGIAKELAPDPESEPTAEETPAVTEQVTEEVAPEKQEEVSTAEEKPETESKEEESLEDLAKLSDEELDAKAKSQEWPESMVRRVKKFTRQLRETQEKAESEIAELKAKAERAEATVNQQTPPTAPDSPIANLRDPRQMDSEIAKAEDVIDEVEKLMLDIDADPEGTYQRLTASGVKIPEATPESIKRTVLGIRSNAKAMIRQCNEQKSFLAAVNQNIGECITEYPELKDTKSKLYGLCQQIAQQNPAMMRSADWPKAILERALGRMYKEAKAKPIPPVTAKPPPPKIPTVPKIAPSKPANNGQATSLKNKAMKSGRPEDVAKFFESQLT